MAAGTEKRWYLGTGQEFVKAQCREYKTLEGALRAAAKNPDFVVWDESGNVIDTETAAGTPTDGTESGNGPEADKVTVEEEKAADGANTGAQKNDEEAEASGADDEATAGTHTSGTETDKNTPEERKDADGANEETKDDDVIVPDGEMRVMVVCDGSLNLRRSAAWGNDNICGRATRGQQYRVKAIHTIDGKKLVETIDGLYLSGSSAHVQFEQL